MKPDAVALAEEVLGGTVQAWEAIRRGYTPAERWVVRLTDGRTAFVKGAVNEDTTEWLRTEIAVYSALEGDFLPRFLGWGEATWPVLVLEDLSAAAWPPPWGGDRVEKVRRTLEAVAATPPPPGLGQLEDQRDRLDGWRDIARDPEPYLSLAVSSRAWLDAVLPALIRAADAAVLDGTQLLHLDVRSDNLCFDGKRTLLVDWNQATVGNPAFDLAFWLPSLALEGGPQPEEVAGPVQGIGEMAAVVAAYFASRAGLAAIPGAPGVRPLQLAQLRVALPWALRALGLPELDR